MDKFLVPAGGCWKVHSRVGEKGNARCGLEQQLCWIQASIWGQRRDAALVSSDIHLYWGCSPTTEKAPLSGLQQQSESLYWIQHRLSQPAHCSASLDYTVRHDSFYWARNISIFVISWWARNSFEGWNTKFQNVTDQNLIHIWTSMLHASWMTMLYFVHCSISVIMGIIFPMSSEKLQGHPIKIKNWKSFKIYEMYFPNTHRWLNIVLCIFCLWPHPNMWNQRYLPESITVFRYLHKILWQINPGKPVS